MQGRVVFLLFVLCAVVAAKNVLTPWGWHAEECVHYAAEDEVSSFDDVDQMYRIRRHVVDEHGRPSLVIDREYPPCPVKLGSQTSEHRTNSRSGAEPNGWAADAYWLTNIKFDLFNGQWNVPHYPQDESVQTLFLFTGLQNSGSDVTIIQPVLQWGGSAAGSSKNWTIASWFVSSSHSSYSSLVGPLEPGDLIVGNMTLASNGDWQIITKDQNNGKTTTLNVNPGVTEVDAFVTLEVYGISTCADYPNGSTTFNDLHLASNGVTQNANWGVSTQPECSEAVHINSAHSVTIQF